MGDLAAFLAARLDEDEAKAKAVPALIADIDLATHTFVMRYHSTQALREVESKRVILAAYLKAEGIEPDDWPGDPSYIAGLRDSLTALASVWSGHPDYDPAWGA